MGTAAGRDRSRSKHLATLGLALAVAAGAPAAAAPPDLRLVLAEKTARIEKVDPSFAVAESDDEAVVHAEILPSGELLLDPKGAGVARVFLYAPRLVRVLEVASGAALPAIEPAPGGACAKPHVLPACYLAWRARLSHLPAAEAPPLELEIETLQAEALAAQAALDKAGLASIALRLSLYGVKLAGAKDAAEERRALRAIWPWILGPLRIDR